MSRQREPALGPLSATFVVSLRHSQFSNATLRVTQTTPLARPPRLIPLRPTQRFKPLQVRSPPRGAAGPMPCVPRKELTTWSRGNERCARLFASHARSARADLDRLCRAQRDRSDRLIRPIDRPRGHGAPDRAGLTVAKPPTTISRSLEGHAGGSRGACRGITRGMPGDHEARGLGATLVEDQQFGAVLDRAPNCRSSCAPVSRRVSAHPPRTVSAVRRR